MLTRKTKNDKEKLKNRQYADWLEAIQQESWQLELLISGFVIFGLFASKPYLNSLTDFLISSNDFALFIGGIISSSLPLAWYIFVTNLILHVFIRGLWIGSIGLRYVSGDIDYDELNYSNAFSSYYKKKHGSFDNFIEYLEKISSLIFSITFLIFFILLSTLIYIGLTIFLINFAVNNSIPAPIRIITSILSMLLLFSGLLILIDFISFGLLKKIKNPLFSKLYFRLNLITTFITGSMVWRPILLNILDNKFSKMFFLISIPYALLVSFFIPNVFFHSSSYYPDFTAQSNYESIIAAESYNYLFYKDELIAHVEDYKNYELPLVQMQSKRIEGDIIEVFVKAHKFDDVLLQETGSLISPLYSKGLQNRTANSFKESFNSDNVEQAEDADMADVASSQTSKSEIRYSNNIRLIKAKITELFDFYLNDEKIDKELIKCDFYLHPIGKTRGLWCAIKVDSLPSGRHELAFRRLICNNVLSKSKEYKMIRIPFIYEQ